uniref:Small nuclear ribonucleoprotein D3 polypeptide n=1 Tax=Myripristis murdjan TaxID=586833 RepID=A0A667Z4R0_9TELE
MSHNAPRSHPPEALGRDPRHCGKAEKGSKRYANPTPARCSRSQTPCEATKASISPSKTTMSNITVTYRDGRVAQLEQVYIRGSKIRFLILPDMLKNAPMLKSMKNKNQGSGAGRGKAAILKAQVAARGRGRGGMGRGNIFQKRR